MATRPHVRPTSPHLSVWKWRANMTVSILHRATGSGMATVGTLLLVWWLAAIAAGGDAYATFVGIFTTASGRLNIIGYAIGIGLTWALFQHMMNGIRHLFLDVGAGYELKTNRMTAYLTMIAGVVLTAAFWLYLGIK